jgi:hypothetical protein
MNTLKKLMIGFIAGVITSLFASGLYLHRKNNESLLLKEVKVSQISGEKITHSLFDYSKKDRFSFITQADGKGRISTEIPKVNIPEARAWMTKTQGIEAEFILIDRRIYGLSYWHRWDSFSFGGGPLISETRFEGIKIGGQFWW